MSRFLLVIALSALVLPCVAEARVVRMIVRLGVDDDGYDLRGNVDVELYDSAPITCRNFLDYISAGAYENSLIHRSQRLVDLDGIGIFQGGNIQRLYEDTEWDGLYRTETAAPIVNEFSTERPNVAGTIAMAKTSDPDSATSQWFFNVVDNPALDDPANSGGFTVFGHVVAGMDIVQYVGSLPNYDLRGDVNSPFGDLPVLGSYTQTDYDAGYGPYLDEFVYIETAFLIADADGDGLVGAADYIALKRNFGTESGATWEQGDFDGDGDVDYEDKYILEYSYGQGPSGTAAPDPAGSVPEPATLSLLALGWVAMMRRRHR